MLRCHVAAFEALGGCPRELLYDRMKTAVLGEGDRGIVYNRALIRSDAPLWLPPSGVSSISTAATTRLTAPKVHRKRSAHHRRPPHQQPR